MDARMDPRQLLPGARKATDPTDDPRAVASEDTSLLFLERNFFPLTYPVGEIERLKSCVQLLGEMLDELRRMGSAAPVEHAEQESITQTT